MVEVAVAAVKAEVIWLPTYSLDFSPMENCWLKVKTLVRGKQPLRGKQPRTPQKLDAALRKAIGAVTAHDIEAWFTHCGY
jgi:transposase